MKWRLGVLLWMCLLAFSGCKTKTVVQKKFWYQITLPKKWKVLSPTSLQSPDPDPTRLTIVRRRDSGSLESYAKAQIESLQIEIPDFQQEDQQYFKIQGRRAWKLVGVFRPKGPNTPRVVRIKVYVASRDYKYDLTILLPAEAYRSRRKGLDKILKTFRFTIPEY